MKDKHLAFVFLSTHFISLPQACTPTVPPLLYVPSPSYMETVTDILIRHMFELPVRYSVTITKCMGIGIVWTLSTLGHYFLSGR